MSLLGIAILNSVSGKDSYIYLTWAESERLSRAWNTTVHTIHYYASLLGVVVKFS